MRIFRLQAWWVLLTFMLTTTAQAGVTPTLQKAIRAATFEVVRKKPERDPLQYEKPLPFELLPYTERADAYESIGTAFSLGNNTYVTAAHVLIVGVNSQFGVPALRSSDGVIHTIDKITKFSQSQDFAIFSLAKDPMPVGFEINTAPQIDDPVLAVGNALGDGIVIRDGLFTSETREDQDGRWKWIRFSAAASPGNSGGPLLDATGRVIGIVIGKSPNENLNYSLPIKQALDAVNGKATFDQRLVSAFPVLRNTRTYAYQDEFKLPLSWAEFASRYEALITRHSEQARTELLNANRERIFPNGPGTESLLFNVKPNYMPRLISQQADNTWAAVQPYYESAELPDDGYVRVGSITDGYLSMVRLHRSNDAHDDSLYSDSKAFMDMVLKGLNLTRSIGADKVRVTSLGVALGETTFTDGYGRKWQQCIWPIPFMDAYVVGMLLPTPDGYTALLQYTPSPLLEFTKSQTAVLADFIDVSYWGTIAQWQSFLTLKNLLPLGLNKLKLASGANLSITSQRFSLMVPSSVLPVEPHSELGIAMGFIREPDRVLLDPTGLWLYRDAQQKSYIELWRQALPPPSAKLELRNQFTDLRGRRSPYDTQSSRETGDTYSVSSAVDAPGKSPGNISADLVYALTLALQGHSNDVALLSKQGVLLNSVRVLEHGAIEEAAKPGGAVDLTRESNNKYDQKKQELLELVEPISAMVGKDSRGRTFADDVKDFVLPAMKVAFASRSQNETAEFEQRARSVFEYWQVVRRLTSHREVWPTFLANNHLPADTGHAPEIKTMEAKLSSVLQETPTAMWATQANALTRAYMQERAALFAKLKPSMTATFLSRQSACPTASTNASSTGKIAFAPNAEPLPDNYPAISLERGEEGLVLLNIQVNESGCATGASIIGSSGFKALDDAALELYESMRFLPARRDGKPFADSATLPVRYIFENRHSNFPSFTDMLP